MSNNQKIKSLTKYSNQTKNLRLALDIGTNSIGWVLYKLNNHKKPTGIIKTGVRIFSSGRNDKDYTTLNATRRQKRLQRRQRDRYLQRRAYLLELLKNHGLFPKDKFSAKKLKYLNPYKLRAGGLDSKLELHHFGRALFHLNQKRGFKSNRKSSNDKESGVIQSSIKTIEASMGKDNSRTYGEFLWRRLQKMEENRKTPSSQQDNWISARRPIDFKSQDNYAVYADRQMIEDEFNQLWDFQSQFHANLKDENLKKKFFEAIFKQRLLKKPIVGICFYTKEKRISKASPYFQKFRILKELNNLSWADDRGIAHAIIKMDRGIEFRDRLIKDFFLKKKSIKFSQIEKAFKSFFPEIDNFQGFNLDSYNRDKLDGDQTGSLLNKFIPDWSHWDLEIQSQFIELLEGENTEGDFMKSDDEVLESIEDFNKKHKLKLSDSNLQECVNKVGQLPSGHAMYSKKAIKKLLPFLEDKAIQSAGLGHHSDKKYKGDLKNVLPIYQEILKDHCVEMSLNPNEKQPYKTFRIPNPTVHIAFNQLRLLVNDIIRIYGKPSQCVIETARDLPLGQITKNKFNKKQTENKKRNEEARKFIEEFNQKNNRENILRYKLWQEQKETCIYSGKKISKTKLYTAELEVDHILPYSKTLDDSYMNKVLVYKQANQGKGDQTPYEYFSSDLTKWQDILTRAKELSKGKQWRFHKDAMEKLLGENKGFLARQLNDTRYISKYAKQYFKSICPEVWTVRGQTTSIIRPLLKFEEKNRDDHRNHAKDALAVGLIDISFVQHISKVAQKIEGQDKTRLENIGKMIKKEVLPWDSFKEDAKSSIGQIIVSHKKRTKKEGQLHNETAYGGVKNIKDFSKPVEVKIYKGIMDLKNLTDKKIEKIISPKIREDFKKELQTNKKITKEFLKEYHKKTGVRRIRLKEKETVIPIKNKQGQIYKTFNPDGNYAIELFKNPKGKWDGKVITRFEANQKSSHSISKRNKLMINDILAFDNKIWRLVKFDRNKQICFVEHFEANVDARNRNKKIDFKYTQKSPLALQKLSAKKVDVSPCGKYKLTDFDLKKIDSIPKRKIL